MGLFEGGEYLPLITNIKTDKKTGESITEVIRYGRIVKVVTTDSSQIREERESLLFDPFSEENLKDMDQRIKNNLRYIRGNK